MVKLTQGGAIALLHSSHTVKAACRCCCLPALWAQASVDADYLKIEFNWPDWSAEQLIGWPLFYTTILHTTTTTLECCISFPDSTDFTDKAVKWFKLSKDGTLHTSQKSFGVVMYSSPPFSFHISCSLLNFFVTLHFVSFKFLWPH